MDTVTNSWGKYHIRRLIAKGGMAEVYEAEIKGPAGFAKQVCLKQIRSELTADEEFVRMFETEARIAALLHHPNIVTVFDFDRHDGKMFLTMEYVDGCDLKQLLSEFNLAGVRVPVGFAIYLADGLLGALEHAHSRKANGRPEPVIHRDVSPHNILISCDGVVKLADFGIAKSTGAAGSTKTGIVKGKLAYLAPEQVEGCVSPLSDLFSAGLVLYEILTGNRLLSAENGSSLVAKLAGFKFQPIAWLSHELNDFLAGLLDIDPAKRFRSAESARNSLRSLPVLAASQRDASLIVTTALKLKEIRLNEKSELTISAPVAVGAPSTRLESSKQIVGSKNSHHLKPPSKVRLSFVFVLVAAIFTAAIAITAIVKSSNPSKVTFGTEGVSDKTNTVPNLSLLQNQLSADSASNSIVKTNETAKSKIILLSNESEEQIPSDLPIVTGKHDESDISARSVLGSSERAESLYEKHAVSSSSFTEESKQGFLNVNVKPWAEVEVDGAKVGTTPIRKLKLKAGTRRIRLENAPLNFVEEIVVNLKTGKSAVINREISK